ncbi:hypothetical protein PENSPDRAFT_679569 [Peniophora sp. CONT]|nr:hypothetical protein PENSPDRAFT_679569 [Peniophora sp. CONT]
MLYRPAVPVCLAFSLTPGVISEARTLLLVIHSTCADLNVHAYLAGFPSAWIACTAKHDLLLVEMERERPKDRLVRFVDNPGYKPIYPSYPAHRSTS